MVEEATAFYDRNKTESLLRAADDVPDLVDGITEVLQGHDLSYQQRKEIAETLSTRQSSLGRWGRTAQWSKSRRSESTRLEDDPHEQQDHPCSGECPWVHRSNVLDEALHGLKYFRDFCSVTLDHQSDNIEDYCRSTSLRRKFDESLA